MWISSEDAAAVAAKGLRLVHSPSDYFYLVSLLSIIFESYLDLCDLGLWCWRMDRKRPRSVCVEMSSSWNFGLTYLFICSNSWCDPFKSWQKVMHISLFWLASFLTSYTGLHFRPPGEFDSSSSSPRSRWYVGRYLLF